MSRKSATIEREGKTTPQGSLIADPQRDAKRKAYGRREGWVLTASENRRYLTVSAFTRLALEYQREGIEGHCRNPCDVDSRKKAIGHVVIRT